VRNDQTAVGCRFFKARNTLRSLSPPIHNQGQAKARRLAQGPLGNLVVGIQHSMCESPVEDDKAIGPRRRQVARKAFGRPSGGFLARRLCGHRQSSAADAIQEQHRTPSGVHFASAPKGAPFVAVAVKVDLDVGGKHSREPPFRSRHTPRRGKVGAQRQDGALGPTAGFNPVEPEGRLVSPLKPFGPQAADAAQQAPEQLRGECAFVEVEKRRDDAGS